MATDHRSRSRFTFSGCIAALLILAACDPSEVETNESSALPVDEEPVPDLAEPSETVPAIPAEVEAAGDWPLGNRDHENSRATFDAQIDSSNVDQLGLAWSMPLTEVAQWGAAASTPIISDGVIYLHDLMSNVYAIDLDSGDVLWVSEQDLAAIGPNGVAIGWGKVFFQDGSTNLIAVDASDGEEIWQTSLVPHTGIQQPTVFGGYVFTGTGAGEPPEGAGSASGRESYTGGSSGIVYALDHATGEIAWEFQVVEEGFWGNPEVNSGGALWAVPAVDTETGTTFWGTGNPGPFPGTVDWPNASSRPGPNLHTNSMIALDAEDGTLEWATQVHPHDLFDLDFHNGPILTTVEIDGQTIDLAIGSGKNGDVVAFNRNDGEIIWERAVGIHHNDHLDEIPIDEEVLVYPGVWGGVQTPKAYADGHVYVLTKNLPSLWTGDGFGAEEPGEAVAAAEARTRLEDGESEFLAIDAVTGDIVWEHSFDQAAFGGATVVNDLVFTATHDGTMYAFSREDGEIVWSQQAPGGIIAWPAVVDDSIVWPIGLGSRPQLLVMRLGAEDEIFPEAS